MTNAAIQHDELDDLIADLQDDVSVETEAELEDATIDIDLDELSDDLEEAEKESKTTQLAPPKVKQADPLDDIEDAEIVSDDEDEPVAKKPKTKAVSRFASGTSLVTFGSQLFTEEAPLLLTADDIALTTVESNKNNLERLDGVQAVKAREKIANVLTWVAQGKTLSKYTRATFELIKEKTEVTKAEVTNHLLDQGVNLGTASSQSGQMTHILLSLKIATYEGGKFVANPDSVLLQMLGSTSKTETAE